MRSNINSSSRRMIGFTLVEVLVVITVIVVLAAISVAVSRRTIDSARAAGCISNLRQLGAAVSLYSGENNGLFPRGGWNTTENATDGLGWLTDIYPMVGESQECFICPAGAPKSPSGAEPWNRMPGKKWSEPRYPFHYAYNAQLNNPGLGTMSVDRMTAVQDPGKLPVMIDIVFQNNFLFYPACFDRHPSPASGQTFSNRHAGKGNVLWGDGRITPMTRDQWADAADRAPSKVAFCKGDY